MDIFGLLHRKMYRKMSGTHTPTRITQKLVSVVNETSSNPHPNEWMLKLGMQDYLTKHMDYLLDSTGTIQKDKIEAVYRGLVAYYGIRPNLHFEVNVELSSSGHGVHLSIVD